MMNAISRRIDRLEQETGGGRVVLTAMCPIPDERAERRRFVETALADGRASLREILSGQRLHIRAHARPLTPDEWVAYYAPGGGR